MIKVFDFGGKGMGCRAIFHLKNEILNACGKTGESGE